MFQPRIGPLYFILYVLFLAPSIDRRTKSQRRSQISSHISSQRSRDRKGRFTPASNFLTSIICCNICNHCLYLASELIDTLDDRLIRTQYIEGTPSNAQGRLSDYTRDTQEGFTQDTLFTDWAQGDESSRLIVDLEAPTFGFKRVKKTVKKPDKPAPNEQTDTPPPEPTITLYGYLFYLSYSTFPFALINFSSQ